LSVVNHDDIARMFDLKVIGTKDTVCQ